MKMRGMDAPVRGLRPCSPRSPIVEPHAAGDLAPWRAMGQSVWAGVDRGAIAGFESLSHLQ